LGLGKTNFPIYQSANPQGDFMTTNHAIIIADLGFGDAGKGSIVDALTRNTGATTVVRP
jgi:hypothetical protein